MSVNLLPWRLKQRRRDLMLWLIVGIMSFSVHLIGWSFILRNAQQALSRLKIQHQQFLQQSVQQIRTAWPQQQHSILLKTWEDQSAQSQANIQALIAVSQALPPDVTLLAIDRQTAEWQLSGLARQALPLFLFIKNLKQRPEFQKITLTSIEQTQYVQFLIQLIV